MLGVFCAVGVLGVFVVVGTVRRVVVAVVHIVDMVAVLDRLMATPGPVLMAVALGLGVPRQRDAAQPGAHRRAHRRDDERPDGQQHDGAARGDVGGIRHSDPTDRAGDADRHGPRERRPEAVAEELGTPVGSITSATRTTNVPLDTAGNTYRYYLLWIEKLPPGGERVKISELELFVPRATRR